MSLVGRLITITKNSGNGPVPVAGMRAKTITYGAETIDVTTDDDEGFRKLLENAVAQRQIDLGLEGLIKDDELLEVAASANGLLVGAYTITIGGFGSISGTFVWSGFEYQGPYNDASQYSCTVQSSGEFTVSPAST
jgi:TP901-1 family phage major tail protein